MANKYWVNASGNELWSTSLNWSTTSGGAGGAGAPSSGDNVYFNGGGNYSCFVDQPVNINMLNVGSGYAGTLEFNSNHVILDYVWIGSGHFILNTGSGNWYISGNWEYDVNMVANNSSLRVSGDLSNIYFTGQNQHIKMQYWSGTGYGRREFGYGHVYNNLHIKCARTGTGIPASFAGLTAYSGSNIILEEADIRVFYGSADIYGNVIASGLRTFFWSRSSTTAPIGTPAQFFTKYPSCTIFTPDELNITLSLGSPTVLNASTWDCGLRFTASNSLTSGTLNDLFIFGSGDHYFNSFFAYSRSPVNQLYNGNIDNSINNANLHFRGGITGLQRSPIFYRKGTGYIIFEGSNDQTIRSLGSPAYPMEDIYINKPAGLVTLNTNMICDNFYCIDGDLYINNKQLTITNDVVIDRTTGFQLSNANNYSMSSGVIDYGGILTLKGASLSDPLYIQDLRFVNTTNDNPRATNCHVTRSDKTGTGPDILAYNIENIDNGENTGWDFRRMYRSVIMKNGNQRFIVANYV